VISANCRFDFSSQATGQADHDATVEQLALKLQQQAKLMEAEVAPPVQTPSPTPAIGPGSLGGDISKASPAHATNEAPILDTPAPGMPTPLPNTTSPQFVRRYPKGGPQSITTSLGSVLMSAVDGGKEKIVEQLLDKGADPNTEGALERAAVLNDPKSMQHLLDFGADPNVKNTESRTVLFTACEYDHGDAVMLLLERGADPNLPGPDPPIWAAIPHPDVLKLLLDAGADSKVPGLLENAAWRDSVPSIQTLLDAGVDINGKNPDGKTALYVACEHDHEDVVELLLRKGADPNFPGPDPPIRAAIQYSNILELLLEAGADFKASGLLENAAWHNSTQSIKTLLDSGVDINDKNPDGKTALYVACEYDHEDVVGLLLERGADPNLPGPDPPISVATRHPNILKLILDAGANPNTPGSLELAAWHDSAPSAQHLIAAGADVNAEHDGKTALRTACTWGHLEVVNVLLENGADVNAKDESGATALDLAAGAGHDDVVSSLLSHL
jgi:ankyrin repeat protein